MSNPIVNGKRVHRKPRNGHSNSPGDRGASGTRLSPQNDHRTRALIKTVLIIKRLNEFVLGEAEREVERTVVNDKGKKKKIKVFVPVMTTTQVAAALGLLRKTLPDLNLMTHKGDAENPVIVQAASALPNILEKLEKMGKVRVDPALYQLVKQPDGTYSPT
jgi:hypothetical protein